MSYVIASGWWCNGNRHPGTAPPAISDIVVGQHFSRDWLNCIERYLNPEKILIIDSASPLRPAIPLDSPKIEFLSLAKNFGHVSRSIGKYCGGMRAFILGRYYALMNDMDYVFIEQDVMFHGDIVTKSLECMNENNAVYSHGLWSHSLKVEQSFVVIRNEAILEFFNRYMDIPHSDKAKRPEYKLDEIIPTMKFVELPFGYGRIRPINFNDEYLYAQKLSDVEIEKFREVNS